MLSVLKSRRNGDPIAVKAWNVKKAVEVTISSVKSGP